MTDCESGPVYVPPPPSAYVTHPQVFCCGDEYKPTDDGNDDWAALVADVQRGLRAS